ncbi:hypothetical protein AHF37_05603 [Paragonimus kellicotti]|nr:hypothetical protein AHF37_05603 [Paragonimus kellicotti]
MFRSVQPPIVLTFLHRFTVHFELFAYVYNAYCKMVAFLQFTSGPLMAWWLLLLLLLLVVILWIIKKMHFSHRDCMLTQRLDGKVVVVTGCNQGIGYETVGELVRRGARVIMACRDLKKAELARHQLLKRFAGSPESDKQHSVLVNETQLTCEELDLESPASIRAFASRMRKQEQVIHILINNAAINLRRPQFDADGIERHLKVNHLGPFLLTQLLYPLLQLANGDARVINVSSFNHRLADLNMSDLCRPKVGSCYSNSKLVNVIHAKELSRRWQESGIVAVSLHPGLVKTELFRHMPFTRLTCEELDLESPASIRAFASRMRKQEQVIHILINNAAINLRRPQFDADGIERHLKVNHLGPFLLTQLLYPLLQLANGDARVINVSSFNHRLADLNMSDLCRPKLVNVIHAKELSRRWQESGIVAVSLHPGLVKTELFRHMPFTRWIVHTLLGWLSKSAWQGAQTVIHCCLADDLIPGAYYHECRVARTSSQASDPEVGEFLWQASEKLIDHWESGSSSTG